MLKKVFYILFSAFLFGCYSDDEPSGSGLIKQEFIGELDSVRSIGGSDQDDFLSVVATQDGGAAALGFTQSNDGDIQAKSTTDSDYWLVKFNEDLSIEWQKVFGGSSDDRGQSIIQTENGGFAVTGFSGSSDGNVSENSGFKDLWVVKLDVTGEIQWEKSFGYAGDDIGYDLIQTDDGGYFLTGFIDDIASNGEGNDNNFQDRNNTNSYPKHGVGKFWGIKLSPSGDPEWRRYFGGTNNDRSYSVLQTSDGGFIQAGYSESDDIDLTDAKGSYDMWVVKTGVSGDLEWQKSFGGTGIDIAYDIIETEDGHFMIVGDTRSDDQDVSDPKGSADVWIIKMDSLGNLIWERTYGGPDFDSGRSIIHIGNDEYFVTSSSQSQSGQLNMNYGSNDAWTFIIDGNGDMQWQKNLGGSNLDFGNDASISPTGSIFVVGNTQSTDEDFSNNNGGKDAFILKLR